MTKPNIWVFSLEPLESRYTCEWFEGIPNALRKHDSTGNFNVVNLAGIQIKSEVTDSAFLNFSDTNYWKSSQLLEFIERYNKGEVGDSDIFLFTDFWNPAATQIKYMSDLMGKNWEIHGICHAGAYDPADFLGRLPADGRWATAQELSFFHSFDYLYFATNFHKELFIKNVLIKSNVQIDTVDLNKLQISGQPHEFLVGQLNGYKKLPKRDLILFPHRLATEKQPEIFRDLAESMPEYEFVVCQDTKLTKEEYHTLLLESKITFSASLQETMGISSCIEAPLLGSVPLVPSRLSYAEVFENYLDFEYPAEWTENWELYLKHKEKIMVVIHEIITSYDKYERRVAEFVREELPKYTSAKPMFNRLLSLL